MRREIWCYVRFLGVGIGWGLLGICTLYITACTPPAPSPLIQPKTSSPSQMGDSVTVASPTQTPTRVRATIEPTRQPTTPIPTVPTRSSTPPGPSLREGRFLVNLRVNPEVFLGGDRIGQRELIKKVGDHLVECFKSMDLRSINPQRVFVYGSSPDWKKGDTLARETISIIKEKLPALAHIEPEPHHKIVESDPTRNGIIEIEITFIPLQGGVPSILPCDFPPESWCYGEKEGAKLIVINWASPTDKIIFQINNGSYVIEPAYGDYGIARCIQLPSGKNYPWIAQMGARQIQNTIRVELGVERQIVLCVNDNGNGKEKELSFSCSRNLPFRSVFGGSPDCAEKTEPNICPSILPPMPSPGK